MQLTNEEETRIRSALSEASDKLSAVESEAARLRDRLAVLSQRKKDTEDFIKVHQGLLSPIRRLLPEILQEIFCRCLPVAHNSVFSFTEAPLLLGRVCNQWRRIAYSTPALWSSLHINIVPLTSPAARARFEIFDAWLTRSGILPLSISMFTFMRHDMLSQDFQPYFNLITKHVRRWKHMDLSIDSDSLNPMHLSLEVNASDLPLLELFSIRVKPSTTHSLLKAGGILMAPSLCNLSIFDYSLRLLDLPIQWSKLTRLDLGHSSLSDTLEILSLCSNLKTCVLNVGASYHQTSIPTMVESSNTRPKIVLPQLQTLEIYEVQLSQNNDLLTILHNLFAPALRHFTCQLANLSLPLDPSFPEHSSPQKIFRSFFRRLNEPLEELEIYNHGSEGHYLMEILYLCPGVKRLSLKCRFFTLDATERLFNDRVLSHFIPHEHGSIHHSYSLIEEPKGDQVEANGSVFPSLTCLCPNLEVLYLDGAGLSKHTLLEFLHSRLVDYDKYDIARLRRFEISYHSGWDDDDDMAEEIDRLIEKSGVLVKFDCPPRAPTPVPWYPPSTEDPFIQGLPEF